MIIIRMILDINLFSINYQQRRELCVMYKTLYTDVITENLSFITNSKCTVPLLFFLLVFIIFYYYYCYYYYHHHHYYYHYYHYYYYCHCCYCCRCYYCCCCYHYHYCHYYLFVCIIILHYVYLMYQKLHNLHWHAGGPLKTMVFYPRKMPDMCYVSIFFKCIKIVRVYRWFSAKL